MTTTALLTNPDRWLASEALMALPNLSALKHEHHHNHHNGHHHHSHHHSHHSSLNHLNNRSTHSETSVNDRSNGGSPLLHTNVDETNRPVAVVHGKKNRLAYGSEDELVTTSIKRFCLSNEREANLSEHNTRFLISNYITEEECSDECANDIRCQHRHSSSVPDLRTTIPGHANHGNQSHSTASSPSASSTPTPTNSVLSQILAAQQYMNSSSPSNHDLMPSNSLINRSGTKFQYVLGASTSMAVKLHEETMTYLNQG